MNETWTKTKAECPGELVDFPEMMAQPRPVEKPHPPILVGGAFPPAARRAVRDRDGWAPIAAGPMAMSTSFRGNYSSKHRQMGADRRRPVAAHGV